MREVEETEQNQQDFTFIVGRKRGTEDDPSFQACIIESMINAIN